MRQRYATRLSRLGVVAITLSLCVAVSPSNAQEAPAITKKQVATYLQRNKEAMVEYACTSNAPLTCSVVCSSGGNDYIDAKNVSHAFYGERRSSINGAVTGYYLVIDVNDSKTSQDIWATLQVESSCLFKGMTPKLE